MPAQRLLDTLLAVRQLAVSLEMRPEEDIVAIPSDAVGTVDGISCATWP